jgi:ankyrin repeat protein
MPDLKTFQESVKRGDLEAVRETLAEQPELLNGKNEAGQSAFLLANYYGQKDVAAYLLSLDPELDIFTACIAGLEDRVLPAVEQDRSVLHAHSTDGWTPLHLTAFFGRADLAAKLIGKGAEVDARSTNQMQNTPLHAAVAGRKHELVKLLLAQGANVNATQSGGWTALHGAAQNGDLAIVESLLEAGAHVHAQADNNQTALDLALTKGHADVAGLLQLAGEEAQQQ